MLAEIKSILNRRFLGLDSTMLSAIIMVQVIGLAVLYSASGNSEAYLIRQLVRIVIGFVLLIIISQIHIQFMKDWTPLAYIAGAILLVLVIFLGEGRGANRWLDLGFVRFQPSEIMKLAVPMMTGWLMYHAGVPAKGWKLIALAVIIVVPAVLIAKQPDLGTALLISISGVVVVFASGISWKTISAMFVAAMVSMPILWQNMHDYQKGRVLTFLNPESDPLGKGWNIIQSKIAIGSGGLLGKGWLQGTQAHLEFLPERSTDFILAVLSEEFGFIGVLLLLGLYLLIGWRSFLIALEARDIFTRLVALAFAATFQVYVLVNFGMVSGVLPVVGVPLPLISYGGTSMVTLMMSFGVLMSISRDNKRSHK